ncbi:MAG: glycosyltransferase family A protein, partial [Candidatus Margulisiibacteriota bacterium]
MPKFSVIIPLYNGEKYIARALDCVKAQTFKDLEVVVCNDGSPDASADIVNNYIRDNRGLQIKLVSQKNRGLGGARNTAIRNAEGEYMALLDQDDIWYPNKLERINEVLEKE